LTRSRPLIGLITMATVDIISLIITTIAVFAGVWLLLFILWYFVTPFYMKYGDRQSRLIYSAIYSLAFAFIIGVGYGLMPALMGTYGFWPTMITGLIIVLILTTMQNYVLSMLMQKGMLKMSRK